MSHKLTLRQRKAIHLIAEGKTNIEVAKIIGCRRETLSRWKRQSEFSLQLSVHIQQVCDDMRYRLTCLVDESITAVSDGMEEDNYGENRLKVAFSVLKLLGIDRMMVSDHVETTIKRDKLLAKWQPNDTF